MKTWLAAIAIAVVLFLVWQYAVSKKKSVDTTLSPASSAALNDGAYGVDVVGSRLSWQANKIVGATHSGTVDIKSGELQAQGGRLQGGSFVLDMTTIKNDEKIEALLKHLNSADFFDTANFPEAKLSITAVEPGVRVGEYAVKADLTIKGHTNPIEFTATAGDNDGVLEVASNFTIDRTKWDIRFGSGKFFDNLGNNLINDLITFGVSLKASKK